MKVALIVDNPSRDLSGLVLSAVEMVRRGATVYLVPMYYIWNEVLRLVPDIVIMPHLRVSNQDTVGRLQELGFAVGTMETEGGPAADLSIADRSIASDQAVLRKMALYSVWGRRYRDHALERGWFTSEQIAVTGSPRYDFYAPKWRETALRLSDHSAGDVPQPFVLINASFPLHNPRYQTREQEKQMLLERFSFDPQYVEELFHVSEVAFNEMINIANRLAARFPQVMFVYRPHPFEKVETYHGLLNQRDNIVLTNEGTVDGWILRAKAVIRRGCTTSVESTMSGVPAFSPSWLHIPSTYMIAESVGIQVDSMEAMEAEIERAVNGHYTLPAEIQHNLQSVIDDWYCALDGNSHLRLADAILAHHDPASARIRLDKCSDVVYRIAQAELPLYSQMANRVRKAFSIPETFSFKTLSVVAPPPPEWVSKYQASGKYFDAQVVRQMATIIAADKPDGARVAVAPAQERGDYHFGYPFGQSVTVFTEN